MRISTSKTEAQTEVLIRKIMECLLQVWGEVLNQVEDFKYLGVLVISEERM